MNHPQCNIPPTVQNLALFYLFDAPRVINNGHSSTLYTLFQVIPMGCTSALYMASLTSVGVLLGYVILKENISRLSLISMSICFIGLSLILLGLTDTIIGNNGVSPGDTTIQQNVIPSSRTNISFLDLHRNSTDFINVSQIGQINAGESGDRIHRHIYTGTITELIFGVLGSILSGVVEAVSIISLKYIQDDITEVHILTFWTAVAGIILSTAGMIVFEINKIDFPHNLTESLFLVGHGTAVAAGMFSWVAAMEKTSAHVISIVCNAQIPLNMVFQYVIVKHFQPISGGIYDIIGACVVTVGLVIPPVIEYCNYNNQYQVFSNN